MGLSLGWFRRMKSGPGRETSPLGREEILRDMMAELNRAPAIYRPSKFWNVLTRDNLKKLSRSGLAHFKRTINQNYYNWVPLGFEDNQLRNLLGFWAKNPSLIPLRTEIHDYEFLEGFFDKNPFLDRDKRDIYKLFVGLLWYYTGKTDSHGILGSLSEPEVGDPIRISLNGKLISQDLANSVRERNGVWDFLEVGPGRKPVIAELGAGYGRLAHVFSAASPCRYLIFDIPPALFVSQWYLASIFPGKTLYTFRHFDRFDQVRAEIEAADIAFFTPNQLELFPDRFFDAFISISSLQEMTPGQVENYRRLIMNTSRGLVYLKQWLQSRNPYDDVAIEKNAYMLPAPWAPVLDRNDFIQDLFFETIFRKVEPAKKCA